MTRRLAVAIGAAAGATAAAIVAAAGVFAWAVLDDADRRHTR